MNNSLHLKLHLTYLRLKQDHILYVHQPAEQILEAPSMHRWFPYHLRQGPNPPELAYLTLQRA